MDTMPRRVTIKTDTACPLPISRYSETHKKGREKFLHDPAVSFLLYFLLFDRPIQYIDDFFAAVG